MIMPSDPPSDAQIVRVRNGVLCEWWCVPVNVDESDVLQALSASGEFPVHDAELVPDRRFDGFYCENSNRRHVAIRVGQYTFVQPNQNAPLSDAERLVLWRELMTESVNT